MIWIEFFHKLKVVMFLTLECIDKLRVDFFAFDVLTLVKVQPVYILATNFKLDKLQKRKMIL